MRWIILILALLVASPAGATDWCADANAKGCWLFTEGAGTTVSDASGEGHSGSFDSSGHPGWSSTVPKAYVQYTASFVPNDKISVGDITANEGNLSVTAWVNITNYNYYNAILAVTNGSQPDPFDTYTVKGDGKLSFFIGNGSLKGQFRASSGVPTGTFTHIACTVNNGTSTGLIYYNGVSQTKDLSSLSGWTTIDHSSNGFIGGRGDGVTHMNGLVTEVGYFTKVLSSTEISEIMDYGLQPAGTYSIIRNSTIRNSILR